MKYISYFSPGEERNMESRVQFTLNDNGICGAIITYPLKGYPWRKNIMKSFEFKISKEKVVDVYKEIELISKENENECYNNDELWADSSEKANSITRHRNSGVACVTIGVCEDKGNWGIYFSMMKTSPVLQGSILFKTINDFISPYVTYDLYKKFAQQGDAPECRT